MKRLAVAVLAVVVLAGCQNAVDADRTIIRTPAWTTATALDAVESIQGFLYISHRGGMARFPEESMEGFRTSIADGFPAELDIRGLADGTLVCHHDAITRWRPGLATFEQVLDELGGTGILMPELKDSEFVDSFLGMLKSHSLEDSTIVQSFDWDVATRSADEGFYVCFLVGASTSIDLDAMADRGIEYVGVSTEATRAFVSDLMDHGLEVLVYTVNTPAAVSEYARWGVSGVFTDDPWSLAP